MVYRGHVQNRGIVLDDAVTLPEGAEVRVELVPPKTETPSPDAPSLFERLQPVIGKIDGLPADASQQVDHYLYGHPKQ